MKTRTLTLKRDTLSEIDLAGVVGGRPTWFSCLDYISCNPLDCLPETTICPE